MAYNSWVHLIPPDMIHHLVHSHFSKSSYGVDACLFIYCPFFSAPSTVWHFQHPASMLNKSLGCTIRQPHFRTHSNIHQKMCCTVFHMQPSSCIVTGPVSRFCQKLQTCRHQTSHFWRQKIGWEDSMPSSDYGYSYCAVWILHIVD
jgi:hypothetical protein